MMGRYDAQPDGQRITFKHMTREVKLGDSFHESRGMGSRTPDIDPQLRSELGSFLADGPKKPSEIRDRFNLKDWGSYRTFMYTVTHCMPEVYEETVMIGRKRRTYIGLVS